MFHVAQMDAIALLQELGDDCVDLTFSDVAYESLERHRKRGTTTRLKNSKASSNEWFETISNDRMVEFFHELYRIHKPRSHCYIMADEVSREVYKELARDAGFWVWKSVLWVKTKKGAADKEAEDLEEGDTNAGTGYHWRNCTEGVLFLEKMTSRQVPHAEWTVHLNPRGKGRQLNYKGWPDCIACPPVINGYPTEKPIPLVEKFILNSSDEGALVIDPFCGSGSTGEAALLHNREFLGGDIKLSAVETSRTRLEAL